MVGAAGADRWAGPGAVGAGDGDGEGEHAVGVGGGDAVSGRGLCQPEVLFDGAQGAFPGHARRILQGWGAAVAVDGDRGAVDLDVEAAGVEAG